jgi:hypothetical protein
MLEQHPVPQNVTTFQFRLIGDMTIKQFGYLAGGAVLAYISFNLPLPFFFRYPLTAIFGLGGIGFAFVPIEERPMDVWFLSFIKSIYSPTQYLWQREAVAPTPATPMPTGAVVQQKKSTASPFGTLFDFFFLTKKETKKQAIQNIPAAPAAVKTIPPVPQTPQPPQKQPTSQPRASWLGNIFSPSVSPKSPMIPQRTKAPAFAYAQQYPAVMASAPIPSVSGKRLDTTPQTENTTAAQAPQNTAGSTPPIPSRDETRTGVMEQKLRELEEQLEKEKNSKDQMSKLQEQLVGALNDKQRLEQELEEIRRHQSQQQKPQEVLRNAGATTPTQQSQATVNVFTPDAAKSAGIPTITTTPNVVSGIIRERTGNLLVGILVTVKDREDIPVRALKTSKLGQFAASTPLANGTYTLEIEDPKGQFYFDQARVTLNGNIIPPIEIIAKTQQELDRKKLEHAVFGNNT